MIFHINVDNLGNQGDIPDQCRYSWRISVIFHINVDNLGNQGDIPVQCR